MATHSSVLAWRIPGMGESGGLPSIGSHRVRHDWSDLAVAVAIAVLTLSTKVFLVKAMVFPVVMYGCESWTIKKAEHRRIDAFELWCWRRLLRVSWTARRSNQSIRKEISPGCSLEGLMLKLKLQYFGHLMWRADTCEKALMMGRAEGRRRRGRQMMRWLDHRLNGHEFGWTPGVGDGQGGLACCGSRGCRVGHDWATELEYQPLWAHAFPTLWASLHAWYLQVFSALAPLHLLSFLQECDVPHSGHG